MAIIGSGVTGCSVSSHLLENALLGNRTVTVFEARTLTSGATSRNAGFLLSHIPKYFKEMVEGYGEERAISIAQFCNRTLEKMSKLATSEGPDVEKASEKRSVRAVLAYEEEESLQAFLESVQLYEEMFPEEKGLYSVITRETAEKVRRKISCLDFRLS
jgi:glycine/D-amino acid oxidase-like deaminating enzyme